MLLFEFHCNQQCGTSAERTQAFLSLLVDSASHLRESIVFAANYYVRELEQPADS
jgi:hypothetical protein